MRDVDTSKAKQAIINGIVSMIESLTVRVVAEGVDTMVERAFLRNAGIELKQGYLFCKPAFRAMGIVGPSSWDLAPRQ